MLVPLTFADWSHISATLWVVFCSYASPHASPSNAFHTQANVSRAAPYSLPQIEDAWCNHAHIHTPMTRPAANTTASVLLNPSMCFQLVWLDCPPAVWLSRPLTRMKPSPSLTSPRTSRRRNNQVQVSSIGAEHLSVPFDFYTACVHLRPCALKYTHASKGNTLWCNECIRLWINADDYTTYRCCLRHHHGSQHGDGLQHALTMCQQRARKGMMSRCVVVRCCQFTQSQLWFALDVFVHVCFWVRARKFANTNADRHKQTNGDTQTHACIHIHACVFLLAKALVLCVRACIRSCVRVCVRALVCVCVYVCASACACVNACVSMCAYKCLYQSRPNFSYVIRSP